MSTINQGKCHMWVFFLLRKLSVISGSGRHQNRTEAQDIFSLSFDGGDGPILHHCKGAGIPMGLGGHAPTYIQCVQRVARTDIFICNVCNQRICHIFSEGKLLQWKWCETGGWFTALFRRRCFHSQLCKQYIISWLRWGYVLLSHEASPFASLHVLPAKPWPVDGSRK